MFCSCVYICIYFHFPLLFISLGALRLVYSLVLNFCSRGAEEFAFYFFPPCLFPELFLQFNKSNTKHGGGNKHPHDGTMRDMASLIGYTALEHRTKEPVTKKISCLKLYAFKLG